MTILYIIIVVAVNVLLHHDHYVTIIINFIFNDYFHVVFIITFYFYFLLQIFLWDFASYQLFEIFESQKLPAINRKLNI